MEDGDATWAYSDLPGSLADGADTRSSSYECGVKSIHSVDLGCSPSVDRQM